MTVIQFSGQENMPFFHTLVLLNVNLPFHVEVYYLAGTVFYQQAICLLSVFNICELSLSKAHHVDFQAQTGFWDHSLL